VPGARLHVRAYAGELPTLLLFHGNGEVVADYDDAAEHFARAGVSLVVADYRGYGASTGTPSLRRLIEDARIVAEAIQPAFVMGRSLGGAAAHELYARPVASMRGVVLESAFCDLGALILRRGLEPPREYSPDELAVFDPAGKLRRGTLPLLVLHGERDQLIVPDEARLAYAAAGSERKSIAFIPDRGHNDLSLAASYWSELRQYFSTVKST
jgi:alpha-beta hydrolase superfamily lysophospholipase